MRRFPARGAITAGAIVACSSLLGFFALASINHTIIQKGRAFNVAEVHISPGESLSFSNEDEFLHQIYVQSTAIIYDSAEQQIGEVITVNFPKTGTFEVRCHIHPKMLLKVDVR